MTTRTTIITDATTVGALENSVQEIVKLVVKMSEAERQILLIQLQVAGKTPVGISGDEAIRLAREIGFDSESLEEMRAANDEAFEQNED